MRAKYTKSQHGFTIVLTGLRRNLLREDFLRDIHNVLVEPAGTQSENPVLLGAVDTANNLPKWFPFKVQYQFPGSEYLVGKLWLIANNQRTIFILDGHPHDLATVFAAYSQAAERRKAGSLVPVATSQPPEEKSPCHTQSATTASQP